MYVNCTYRDAFYDHLRDIFMAGAFSVDEYFEMYMNSSYEEDFKEWIEWQYDEEEGFSCIKCGVPIEAHVIDCIDDYILCSKCWNAMNEMIHNWFKEKNEEKKHQPATGDPSQ